MFHQIGLVMGTMIKRRNTYACPNIDLLPINYERTID